MILTSTMRIHGLLKREAKVCRVIGCKRPLLRDFDHCRTHVQRKFNYGTTKADHTLTRLQRRPYVQGAFSWLKSRIRKHDLDVLATVREFDSYIRACEPQHISDLTRKHLGNKRKADGILRGVLKRWPDGYQASIAILSCCIGVRLACKYEPDTCRHPAFSRAMVVNAITSLLRNGHPRLCGRNLANRIHEATDPHVHYMKDTAKRDRDILERVVTRDYNVGVRWETLSAKYLNKGRT